VLRRRRSMSSIIVQHPADDGRRGARSEVGRKRNPCHGSHGDRPLVGSMTALEPVAACDDHSAAASPRVSPHGGHRRCTRADDDLAGDLEAVTTVERHVPWIRALEVGGQPLGVATIEHVAQHRGTDPLALGVLAGPEGLQVVVLLGRVDLPPPSSAKTRCSRRPSSSLRKASKTTRPLGSNGSSGPVPANQLNNGSSANALASEHANTVRSAAVADRTVATGWVYQHADHTSSGCTTWTWIRRRSVRFSSP
jgi:hypothetical protein